MHCSSLLAGSLTMYLAEYAAIVYDDIFAVATQSFWHLHPEELVVLQMVLHAVPESSTLAQIPVHLTHTSSEGSWHLMIATLTAGRLLTHKTVNRTPATWADRHVMSVPNVKATGAVPLTTCQYWLNSMWQPFWHVCCIPNSRRRGLRTTSVCWHLSEGEHVGHTCLPT